MRIANDRDTDDEGDDNESLTGLQLGSSSSKSEGVESKTYRKTGFVK